MIISRVMGAGGTGFQVFVQKDNNPGYYADAAARDVYFGANPDELTRLDQDQYLIIRLTDGGSGSVAYQQRASSTWVDVTSLVQGATGPAGATGNSFFFESIAVRDTFFGTSPNEGLLENGLPIVVNIGDDTQSTFVWGGPSTPVSYDATLWRLAASEVAAGTLFLGVSGASISSGSEVLNFVQADGGLSYLPNIEYDDTGTDPPFYWKYAAKADIPLAALSTQTLTDPQTLSAINASDLNVESYTLIPATSGEMRVEVWLGTDETGPNIVDHYQTVDPGDVGNQTVFQAPNNTIICNGQATYTKFSGVTLKGDLQTAGPFAGQTVPFVTLAAWAATKAYYVVHDENIVTIKAPDGSTPGVLQFTNSTNDVKGSLTYDPDDDSFNLVATNTAKVLKVQDIAYIHKGAIDGRIDIEAVTTAGSALLTLSDAGGGTRLTIKHNDGSDDSSIISDIGNLIIGTDESDTYINISPDGATGFKKVPTAGYVFDIYAAGSDIVGLYSEQGVVLETGTYGNAASANFIFNKGDEGTNVSEFVMYNDNNATAAARNFRMSFATNITTSGGLTVWKQRNNVAVGVYSEPDSVFTVSENTTETGDQAGITVIQEGAGDAVQQFLLTGSGQRWVTGASNSGGDAYMIASSLNLGSDTRFIINTTGEVKIPLSLMIGSESNPESELHVVSDSSDITNWDVASGLILQNTDTTDDNYTLIINKGASNIAAGILFKNDDHSANYGHMVFSARDANGFEENALIIKPAHIEIANSTNTPYGGSGVIENLLTYSEQIDNAIWQTLGSNPPVVVANDTVAPNGETTADKVTISGGAGYLRHNVTLVEDDTYMLSFWARNISGDKTLQVGLEISPYVDIELISTWKRYHVEITAGASNLVVFRSTGSSYYLWGVQLHAGTDETPYIKTEATAFDTATHGASVNGDLVVSGSVSGSGGQTFATKGPEVVEVWSLDDMPRVGGTGDVIPEYKLYRFMQEIDWGTTRLKLENDAYALFEGADVFVTSQTYSGTDPWIYGEGTIRCVGNGMTWKMTGDNATMFDITSGGWGMDYSTLMTTGDNCSLGTIIAPSVTNPLLGARFISTRSLFQGFKTGLTVVNPGNIHIDVSFFHDSTDAVGPMLSIIGLGKAGVIESTEVTMSSATSDFLYISPITEAPLTCLGITLADEQSFFTEGDTGDITLFADASVSSESVSSVSNNSGIARFNFSAPPTLFVGQKVTMSSFTNYDNGTFTITATGAGYYETGVAYNIADTGGSFTSDSVTVTSATHGLSELDAVLICCTMEYNHGSTIYNVQTNTFQVNTPWHTAETTGEWNDGSLDHTSKYVTSFNNGAQQNSHPLPSFNVADNTTTTSSTTSWGSITFGTTGSALVVGASNENFVLLDDVTGLIRYEGLDPITIKMTPSISMFKGGGDVEHQFRLFKTTGTPAFDPHTVKRGISGDTGALSLNCSAVLNPGDEFRPQVKATSTGSTITISDFSL